MKIERTRSVRAWVWAVLGVLAMTHGAFGQAQAAPAKPRQKSSQAQRRAPIDLQTQAKDRRPGQVMPGDPAPGETRAGTAGAESVVDLPDTSPASRAAPIKPEANEAPTAAENGFGAAPAHQGGLGVAKADRPGGAGGDRLGAVVEPGVIGSPVAAAGFGPASVRVATTEDATAELRGQGSAWGPVVVGQAIESRVEVRGGLDSEVGIIVDDAVEVRVARLGRVVIERSSEVDGTACLSLTLARGAAEVRPYLGGHAVAGRSQWLARVRTPDREFALTAPARLEYDAFSGTRVRLLATVGE